jgi:hypothetical protein
MLVLEHCTVEAAEEAYYATRRIDLERVPRSLHELNFGIHLLLIPHQVY